MDSGRKAQKVVSVVFDGAILSSTGMAIVDGTYSGLPCLAALDPFHWADCKQNREVF